MSRGTPHDRPHTEPAGESMPPILIVVCGGAVLVFLFLALAIPLGRLWSGVAVTVIGLAAWSAWQREAIAKWNTQRRARSEARRAERAAAQAAAQAAAETAANEKAAASAGPAQATPDIAPVELVPVATMVAVQVPPAPVAVVVPAETPAREEVDPLTAGLAEPLRPFLLAAMSRAEWSRHDLETEARRLDISLGDALREIDAWSRKRFQEPVLVEDGSQIRVQLPLI